MIKRKTNNYKIRLLAFCLIVFHALSAQTTSPFNKLSIRDTSRNYSFIVSGHFHGASTNISTYPASTLLANIDTLNRLHPSFLFSLGDLFMDVNETTINHYQKSLFDKLQMPLFNAVGNHDLSNGNIYGKVFGKTFYSFIHQSELFIVLNTELNDGNIKNEQLSFLEEALKTAKKSTIRNVFIFSHRPVWAERMDKYKNLFRENTRTSLGQNNFLESVYPLLKSCADNKNTYWFSGSTGGGPASFFYDKDAETNVTFIQTAIRDLPRDAVLQVNILNGGVSLKGISLAGQQLNPVETYNTDFWNKTSAPEEKFNFRLLPYLTIRMLKHHFFWIGVISGGILILLTRMIIGKWKKRK